MGGFKTEECCGRSNWVLEEQAVLKEEGKIQNYGSEIIYWALY